MRKAENAWPLARYARVLNCTVSFSCSCLEVKVLATLIREIVFSVLIFMCAGKIERAERKIEGYKQNTNTKDNKSIK